jgi:hypothetical protein
MLMNVHDVSAEDNCCNKQGNSSPNTGTGVHVASCKVDRGTTSPAVNWPGYESNHSIHPVLRLRMSVTTSIYPYRGGKSGYPFYGTEWMSDMLWNDQELDHVFFIFNPHYMCFAAQEMVKLSVIECQKHWNFMTKIS